MAVLFAPWGNQQLFDDSGNPATGWKIYTYTANSSTPLATYTTSAGNVAQSNPIIIDALGFPAVGQIWLTSGLAYKMVLTNASNVVKKTEDNITGVTGTSTVSQWISSGLTPTYLSATSFTLAGDQTSDFHLQRRLQSTTTAGTIYSTITGTAYSTLTTVTVANDSGVLDSGLSAVDLGFLTALKPSVPSSYAKSGANVDITSLGSITSTAYTTGGTLTAYTLTPTPAITAYAAGQSFGVMFNVASGASPTISISGIATPPNLVKQLADGTYSNIVAGDIPINHRGQVTLISATQALVNMPAGSFTNIAYTGTLTGGTGILNVGAGQIYKDAAGNVGLGITAPSFKFQVVAPASGNGVAFRYLSGTNNPGLFFGSNESTKVSTIDASGSTGGIMALATSGVEQFRIDGSGIMSFNSGYGSVAIAYGCRAWVNFNGTGTVAIRASGNVSSITDNGIGDYTINFTTSMPDANYSLAGAGRLDATAGDANTVVIGIARGTVPTISSVRIKTATAGSAAAFDGDYVTLNIIR